MLSLCTCELSVLVETVVTSFAFSCVLPDNFHMQPNITATWHNKPFVKSYMLHQCSKLVRFIHLLAHLQTTNHTQSCWISLMYPQFPAESAYIVLPLLWVSLLNSHSPHLVLVYAKLRMTLLSLHSVLSFPVLYNLSNSSVLSYSNFIDMCYTLWLRYIFLLMFTCNCL